MNSAGWRLLVASLALIAFAFQSYVTQTHIHLVQSGSYGIIKLTGADAGKLARDHHRVPDNKTPPNDDPLKCPLCQAVGFAGHFVAPSAAALLLPLAPVSILPLASIITSPDKTASHIWRGRGPPTS